MSGKLTSAVQSLLHIAGTAGVLLACFNPGLGLIVQAGVGLAGAVLTGIGAVWSWKTTAPIPTKGAG